MLVRSRWNYWMEAILATRRMWLGKTDWARWTDETRLLGIWGERGEALAELIHPGESVIEFGAGLNPLRSRLPEGCRYTPTDLVARETDYLVYDLNARLLGAVPNYDTAVFNGVLEYVHDIDRVVEHLSASTQSIVCSYTTRDLFPSRWRRRSNGWVNDFREGELIALFARHGFVRTGAGRWRDQTIFRFQTASSVSANSRA